MSVSLLQNDSVNSEFTLPNRYVSDRRSPVRWIIGHAIRYWYILIIVLIGAFGNAVLAALVPVYVGKAFNAILSQTPAIQTLLWLAVWIAISQIIRGVLQLGRNFGAELTGQRLERDIRDELYVSLLGKSMTFHSLQSVGDTMARATNDVREINLMFSPGINLVVGSANFLIMPVVLAPTYHPSLIVVPLLFIIAYFVSLWQYLNELKPVTEEVRESFGDLNTRLAEALDGIETVKATAQEQSEVTLFSRKAGRFRNAFVKQGNIEARFLPLLLLGLAEAFGFLHAVMLYRQNAINVGDIVAYFGLIQLFGFPTFVSLFAYSQVSLGLAGARRILELINKETVLDQNLSGYSQKMEGKIDFQGVSYGYDKEEQVLHNISFGVEPGQTIAIVGQTGSGKTSLAKLVNRTYDVDQGRVLIDGIDTRDWNLEVLRSNISVIEQDIFLFSRSIHDNIAFGNRDATRDDVIKAAKAAQAHDFIIEFDQQYDSVIGERGVTLSGGQRQRLALARAFLTDPKILILDDSTSSIDSATEDKIQQAIYAAAKGRTTLIITHRLSQIRWADLILVLRKGCLVASGTHEELMESSDAYRRIFVDYSEM